jgi:hypothetical protein
MKYSTEQRTRKEDLAFGLQKEKTVLPIISAFFNDNIKLVNNRYSSYDFEGDRCIYELKSRTNVFKSFNETLIPYNKIFNKSEKPIKFLFLFIDGLYYIKYSPKKFKDYKLDVFCRNKRADYHDRPALYYYIPIIDLKKIDI